MRSRSVGRAVHLFRRSLFLLPARLRGHAVRFIYRILLPPVSYCDDCYGAPFEYQPGYGEACLFFGLYEAEDRSLLGPVLRTGMVAVDVGANIGWYTAIFVGAAGPQGKVIAIEPLPANLSRIYRHIKLWNHPCNVCVVPAACGNIRGRTKLYLNKYHPGNTIIESKTRNHPAFNGTSMDVDVITIDSLLRELSLKQVDLLKIDVEGAELLVLQGAEEALRQRTVRSIFVEVTDWDCGGSPIAAETHRLLTSCGYLGWITKGQKVCGLFDERPLLGRQTMVLYSVDKAVNGTFRNDRSMQRTS